MDLQKRVHNYIIKHRMISSGDVVLAAVSGGPDSVVMLHILHSLAQEEGFSLQVAHLNHMLRGAEAEEDAAFVAALAKEYGLPVTIEAIDVLAYCETTGLSVQAAAREIRYDFFLRAVRRLGAGKVALAHHADDQAETILMNFLRGAGTGGLKGILPVRDNLFIRPLLAVRRSQIEEYCRSKDLAFRLDPSNIKPVYLRNRIRMELMPYLANNYNTGITEAILRQGEICRADDAYLQKQAEVVYEAARLDLPNGGIGLTLTGIKQMHPALLRRALRMIWRDLTGTERDLSFAHIECITALPGKGVGARIALPGGINAVLSYNSLNFFLSVEDNQTGFYRYILNVPGETCIPETQTVLYTTLLTRRDAPNPAALPPNEALLDLSKLPPQLFVRQRLPGDIFQPYGQQSPMKLKNFLINQKVPREERDKISLICSSSEIVWVAGMRVGEKCKIDKDTESILYIRCDRRTQT
ncbi:MAG: tRNA lysidine(34) synthetase TilS [Peptococcaceae bacterium]|nr:tRNA lysidine(34) synthetase TilS [Peptococcaceae bacterium]